MPIESSSAPGGSAQILDEAAGLLRSLYGDALDTLCVERIVVGVFCTGVKLTNGCGGIAYTPPECIQRAGTRILKGDRTLMRGMRVGDLLTDGIHGPFSDVIRLSALNALSVPFLDGSRYSIGTGDDITDYRELFIDKSICMVGAIIPTLKRLKELGIRPITIIDKKEATQAEADFGNFLPVENTAEALGRCDTAVFTGAAIANGTMEGLIRDVSGQGAIVVVGPTAGFLPEPLFRRNVALVGTVAVTDSDRTLDIPAEALISCFRDACAKYCW